MLNAFKLMGIIGLFLTVMGAIGITGVLAGVNPMIKFGMLLLLGLSLVAMSLFYKDRS